MVQAYRVNNLPKFHDYQATFAVLLGNSIMHIVYPKLRYVYYAHIATHRMLCQPKTIIDWDKVQNVTFNIGGDYNR